MSNFGNFGNFGLGQATTTIYPFFDLWGTFPAQQVRRLESMVAYYPARINFISNDEKKKYAMNGPSKGFVHGYIGPIPGSPRAMSR